MQKITDNYPDATESLISERSMTEEGLISTVLAASAMARISIDYNPLSNTKQSIKNDDSLNPEFNQFLSSQLTWESELAIAEGMSPYGVSATLILAGVVNGIKNKVHWSAISRILFEACEYTLRVENRLSEKEIDELAILNIMRAMRVSRATAKKYVKQAKELENSSR